MTKQLIVNADDYGRTRLVSAGIRSAHLNGIVTSTTVMMNMAGVEEDIITAMQDCPNLGLGVHLNLTGGKPLSHRNKVLSLVDEKGLFPTSSGFIKNLEEISLEEVKLEWDAQIKKFIELTGKEPDHLDSHHHTSYMTPGLFMLMLDSCDNYHCGIRPPLADGNDSLIMDFPEELGSRSTDYVSELIHSHLPIKPDFFYSSFFGDNATSDYLTKLLRNLDEGTTEIMCHPGLPDKELERISSYAIPRNAEREVLEDERIRTLIEELKINLINFGDLV